jgi:hypothetical protein
MALSWTTKGDLYVSLGAAEEVTDYVRPILGTGAGDARLFVAYPFSARRGKPKRERIYADADAAKAGCQAATDTP